jgi:hypothetical protein
VSLPQESEVGKGTTFYDFSLTPHPFPVPEEGQVDKRDKIVLIWIVEFLKANAEGPISPHMAELLLVTAYSEFTLVEKPTPASSVFGSFWGEVCIPTCKQMRRRSKVSEA